MGKSKGCGAIAAIGVDRGGTWTRVAAFGPAMRPVKARRFRTGTIKALPAALKRAISAWPGGPQAPLVIATRGAFSRKWKKPFLMKALRGSLNIVDVVSDAEAAHFAAFRGKPGVLLIAGTGAVAFAGQPGKFIMIGGSNPPSGDPGSGRWLGRQYLGLQGRLAEAARMTHGRCAAYAARLLEKARAGDPDCAALASAAQHELACLLRTAAGYGHVRAALAGGLMNDEHFRAGLMAASHRLIGRRLDFTRARMTAEEAAARLALLGKRKK